MSKTRVDGAHGERPDLPLTVGRTLVFFGGRVIYDSVRDPPNPTVDGAALFLEPAPKTSVVVNPGSVMIMRRERCKNALTEEQLRSIGPELRERFEAAKKGSSWK